MKIAIFKDKKSGGFTAFHTDSPSVIVQVDNVEDIKEKLSDVFHDIMMGSEIEQWDSDDFSKYDEHE